MGRVLAIDFGLKRTGMAISDPLKMIANPLPTVQTFHLENEIKTKCNEYEIECLLIGEPKDLKNEAEAIESHIQGLIKRLKTSSGLDIRRIDERFSSKMASHAISKSGITKKKKQQKSLIDQVAATILLQEFLDNLSSI